MSKLARAFTGDERHFYGKVWRFPAKQSERAMLMSKSLSYPIILVACFYLCACDDTAERELNADMYIQMDSASRKDMMQETPDAVATCEQTIGLYDPFALEIAAQYPDNLLTEPDETSPTGLRLTQSYTDFPWMASAPALLGENFERWHRLSGFALSGKIFFSFSNPIRSDWVDNVAIRDDLILVNLDMGVVDDRDFAINWGTGGRTIYLQPQVPLDPGTAYAIFLLKSAGNLPDGCLTPAPIMSEVLAGTMTDERYGPVQSSYALGLDIAGVDIESILSATVFTTHRDHEVVLEAATNIKRRRYNWRDGSECESNDRLIRCEHRFTARDYRDDGAILNVNPRRIMTSLSQPGIRKASIRHGLYSCTVTDSTASLTKQSASSTNSSSLAMPLSPRLPFSTEPILHGSILTLRLPWTF